MTHNKLNTDQQHYIAYYHHYYWWWSTQQKIDRIDSKKHTRSTDKSGQLSLNRRCLNKPPPTHK